LSASTEPVPYPTSGPGYWFFASIRKKDPSADQFPVNIPLHSSFTSRPTRGRSSSTALQQPSARCAQSLHNRTTSKAQLSRVDWKTM